MELTERFVVPATVERVWQLFNDVPEVVSCMPGAQVTERVDDQTYNAQLAIAVGPIRPKFDVRATIERDDATREGRIHIEAVDKRGGSRARGQIVYKVVPDDAGDATVVELVQQVTLSGPLAQFGRTGVIEDINAQMTRQFAECLATSSRRIVAVADLAGARVALRENNVNLLMTDLNLGDDSGVELAREALAQNPRLPVIVCSGHDSKDLVRSLGPPHRPILHRHDCLGVD